jgi:DNA-binding HxlR family transcriptional regulator
MTRTSTADWPCTIARSVDLFGEGWTLLIMRQAFFGTRRFEDFQNELGISRNILTLRLNRLVEEGLFKHVEYQQRPVRFEYRLTEKGRDVFPIVAAMAAYGDKWLVGDEGTPLILHHTGCDRDMHAVVTCSECADPLTVRNVEGRRGPGYPAACA